MVVFDAFNVRASDFKRRGVMRESIVGLWI